MTVLLAVDPGLAATGWALTSWRDLLYTGTIHTSAKFGSEADRLGVIARGLLALLAEHDPDLVAVEDYTYQGERSHAAAGFVISKLVGIVLGLAYAAKTVPIILDKNTVNRSLGLTGAVPKSRVRAMVEAAMPLAREREPHPVLRNEHEVDAAALAFVAGQRAGRRPH